LPRPQPVVLETRGLTKRFGELVAIQRVDFELLQGEIHCVLGENGAGKSTLMNTIYGLHVPDEGEILVRGQPVTISSPHDALALRIGMVHQHFMLVPPLTVLENVVLGIVGLSQRPRTGEHAERARRLAAEYAFEIDIDRPVGSLSLGQRQQVEILKALYRQSEILILDEPTSILSPIEVDRLFAVLRRLAAEGIAVTVITHKLHEVLAVGDRITVLRRGAVVGRTTPGATSAAELTSWLFGATTAAPAPRSALVGVSRGSDLEVQELTVHRHDGRVAVDRFSLHVRAAEVVGLAGISGNGQLELAEALAGVRPAVSGMVLLGGEPLDGLDPRRRRARGLVYVPEERDAALALELSMLENLILTEYREPTYSWLGILNWRRLRGLALTLAGRFRLPLERLGKPVKRLSGGNQQRVILARSLATRPSALVAAQVTQGLDLATTEYVHELVRKLRKERVAVLYISSDIDELLSLADRIAVVFAGALAGVVDRAEFSRHRIGHLMTSGRGQS
jgi:simple sugar transport system ATP-binding protein